MRTNAELMANINDSGGYARLNRFEVNVTPPISLLSFRTGTRALDRISMNCTTASLPGKSIATREVSRGGALTQKFAHSSLYEDLRLTFMLSDDSIEREFFERWQELVNEDRHGNLSFPSDYYGTVELVRESRSGSRRGSTYIYERCWPINVGQVDFSTEAGTVASFQVAFAYRRWRRENT